MEDNHDEIKDTHDEEMEYERYKKLLLARRTYFTKNPYKSFNPTLNKLRAKLMASSINNDYAFQLLQEHIKNTEYDIEGILSSLEFVSCRRGILNIRISNNAMRIVMLTYNKPQSWSFALRKHGIKRIYLTL